MKNLRMLLVGLVVCTSVEAQNVSAEAGKYERKSVSYINALWLMDGSVKGLPAEKVALMLAKTKESITMSRFDYNPVPESFITDFVDQINAMNFPEPPTTGEFGQGIAPAAADPMLDSVCAVMERTIIPKVLQIVDAEKEMRAAALTTEQQRNSFIADKAKTLGITMDDIQKIMNAAYLYLPLIRAYHATLTDSSYTVGFDAGIIWFRISTTGEKAKAIPVVRKFTHSIGFGNLGRAYPTTDGVLDYQEFAFRSAVKNAARNLLVATQEIPDFRLSGQIVESGLLRASFDLGKKEGILVDDKYRIVEQIENADGSISQKKSGWVMVTAVADSNSKKGYKSRARVISGDAATGMILSEYPRLPIDVVFKGRKFTFATDSATARDDVFDSLSLDGSWGGGLDVQYDIGRRMGIPQLFMDLGFGIGAGIAAGKGILPTADTVALKSVRTMNFELSLVKKSYIRRVALLLQPLYSWQVVDVRTDLAKDTSYSWTTIGMGFTMNGGIEIALGAAVNLGVVAGYQIIPSDDTWSINKKIDSGAWAGVTDGRDLTGTAVNHSGIVAQIYLTWSVPALTFDPVDMLRAKAGI